VSGMPHRAVSPRLAAPAGPASARAPCAKGALSACTQGLRVTARRWGCVHAGSADGGFCSRLGCSGGERRRRKAFRFVETFIKKETHTHHLFCMAIVRF
jgi:hypothetical protein